MRFPVQPLFTLPCHPRLGLLHILQPIRSIMNCLTFFPGLLSPLRSQLTSLFNLFKPTDPLTSTHLTTTFPMYTFELLVVFNYEEPKLYNKKLQNDFK